MNNQSNISFMAVIAMIAIFLSMSAPCTEGSGFLTVLQTKGVCHTQHTYTLQEGVSGELKLFLTADSVSCVYLRTGYSTQVVTLLRTKEAVNVAALMHNAILTRTQYGEK
jgi:hypothetical protein